MRRRLHNAILRMVTALALAAFAFGAMTLDSEDLTIPAVLLLVSAAWLVLFNRAQERG